MRIRPPSRLPVALPDRMAVARASCLAHPAMGEIKQRKVDHLELCATDGVAFRGRTTLLECVQLVHQALPELRYDDVDPSVTLLGKRLRAPLLIAAMTGGSEPSAEVNRELSAIAEA